MLILGTGRASGAGTKSRYVDASLCATRACLCNFWLTVVTQCELLWIFQRDGDITAEDQARVEGTTIEARIKREAADANAAVMYI